MSTHSKLAPVSKALHIGPVDWRRLVEWLQADGVISDEEALRTACENADAKKLNELLKSIGNPKT